mmetsp:Transcript_41034/g.112967  ORF Transcript_41034/g.112967 Transcript_41034/m.112967 type:complete len:329 (-) Transcript_41034:972-1958(-)
MRGLDAGAAMAAAWPAGISRNLGASMRADTGPTAGGNLGAPARSDNGPTTGRSFSAPVRADSGPAIGGTGCAGRPVGHLKSSSGMASARIFPAGRSNGGTSALVSLAARRGNTSTSTLTWRLRVIGTDSVLLLITGHGGSCCMGCCGSGLCCCRKGLTECRCGCGCLPLCGCCLWQRCCWHGSSCGCEPWPRGRCCSATHERAGGTSATNLSPATAKATGRKRPRPLGGAELRWPALRPDAAASKGAAAPVLSRPPPLLSAPSPPERAHQGSSLDDKEASESWLCKAAIRASRRANSVSSRSFSALICTESSTTQPGGAAAACTSPNA